MSKALAREGELFPGAVRFYDSFLSDLAAGVTTDDSDDILRRMYADFDWDPSDQLQLAVFESRGQDGSVSEAQRISALESRCDARGFYRDGRMAAVINLTRSKRGGGFDDEACMRLVRPLARELRCKVGLSERFSGFDGMLSMRVRYEQARFAAAIPELALESAGHSMGNVPAVRAFSSVAMLYFRDKVMRPDRLDTFCHPGLAALRHYDEERGTSLYETLRMFLENDRNTTVTAEALYIHRNTLLKRLSKIALLASVNLDDPECRERLRVSFAVSGRERCSPVVGFGGMHTEIGFCLVGEFLDVERVTVLVGGAHSWSLSRWALTLLAVETTPSPSAS